MAKLTKAQRSAAAKKAARTRKRNKATGKGSRGARASRARAAARTKTAMTRGRTRTQAEIFGRKTVSRLRKRSALSRQLDTEPKAVRNFAKRSIKKGQTPKKAIEQGRVLHNAERIDDSGKLKKTGEKLSKSRLKRLLRL